MPCTNHGKRNEIQIESVRDRGVCTRSCFEQANNTIYEKIAHFFDFNSDISQCPPHRFSAALEKVAETLRRQEEEAAAAKAAALKAEQEAALKAEQVRYSALFSTFRAGI